MKFRFNEIKALNAILWMTNNHLEGVDLHTIAKTFYFADKKALEALGRPIFGDHYIAMKDGPVPSRTYDMLKHVRGDGSYSGGLSDELGSFFDVVDSYKVFPKEPADMGCFSRMEMDFLEESFGEASALDYGKRRDKSHDHAWKQADRNGRILFEDMVPDKNKEAVLSHYRELSELRHLKV